MAVTVKSLFGDSNSEELRIWRRFLRIFKNACLYLVSKKSKILEDSNKKNPFTKSGLYCSIRRAKTETEEEQKEASLGTPRSEGKTFVYF